MNTHRSESRRSHRSMARLNQCIEPLERRTLLAALTIAQEKPVPVYFIGVGEKLEDLETFDAREFALALLG